MTLRILHWLSDGYGTDARITRIVDSREIWIVFAVNPDGAEYDIRGGRFHHWRKNRQPNAGRHRRHRPQPQLRLPLGRRRQDEHEPARHHLPRAVRLLGARDARVPGLPRQPGRGRTPADPRRDHVPRVRAAGDVAVRLHARPTCRRHDDARTTTALASSAGTWRRATATGPSRPATCTSRPARPRDYEYGRYRIFAYTFELSNVDYPRDTAIAGETGAQPGGRAVAGRAGVVPAGRAGGRRSATRAAAPSTTTSRWRGGGR